MRSRPQSSRIDGASIDGGVASNTDATTRPSSLAGTRRTPASVRRRGDENCAIAAAVFAASCQSVSARPCPSSAVIQTSLVRNSRPCAPQVEVARRRRRAAGRRGCASAGTRKPGASSRVTAAPPTASRCSTSVTGAPGPREQRGADQAVDAAADDDHRSRSSARVLQDALGGVLAGRAHDPAARVRGRAAHVQPVDRRPVPRPARHRPVEEQLLERQLALEDVALGQARDRRSMSSGVSTWRCEDQVAGCSARTRRCVSIDRVAERLALRRPRSPLGAGGTARTARSSDMTCLPGGAIDGSTSVGMMMSMYGRLREAAVLRVVVGALHVVDRRARTRSRRAGARRRRAGR